MAVLRWIQDLPISAAIAESDSLWWGYAWWLFVHAVGMGLTAGIGFVVCLRLWVSADKFRCPRFASCSVCSGLAST